MIRYLMYFNLVLLIFFIFVNFLNKTNGQTSILKSQKRHLLWDGWSTSFIHYATVLYGIVCWPLPCAGFASFRLNRRMRAWQRRFADWEQGNTLLHLLRLGIGIQTFIDRGDITELLFSDIWRSFSSGKRKPLPLITLSFTRWTF